MISRIRHILIAIAIAWFAAPAAGPAAALEHVTYRRDGNESQINGKLIVKAEDGGLLILARDGQLWAIEPAELVDHKSDAEQFVPLSSEEVGQQVLTTLPDGFEVYATTHYVICHNTTRAYAQWCGALFERLYSGFTNFWTRRGLKLHEPELPLVCIVFADANSYNRFAASELGDSAKHIVAYYSLKSNRVTMYDLTGDQAIRRAGDRRGSTNQINQMLNRPEAERMVATVIHEATHQIANNAGLSQRFADVPLWVSEGVAVYFEAPDLSNSKGWKTIGEVNRPRLNAFRNSLPRRPADSLATLVADDKRLRDPRQGPEAYAESWALNYFLIRQKPKEYLAYMELMAAKKPLVPDTPEERLEEFKAAFGDLDRLEADFLRHINRVK
jgi:hypothetical protein